MTTPALPVTTPRLLNVGCGHRLHPAWVNLDMVPTAPSVIAHDITRGIPFPDGHFDAVYHSHVLEHLTRSDAGALIRECARVLKPTGTLRVAVPDLEVIARTYLQCLEGALRGDRTSILDREWMMLELYDQAVRHTSGGAMAEYLSRPELDNEDFVLSRIGDEARRMREAFRTLAPPPRGGHSATAGASGSGHRVIRWLRTLAGSLLGRSVREEVRRRYEEIGRFRLSGEIHQWMYDRFSLAQLMSESGFREIQVQAPTRSIIPGWSGYGLEVDLNAGVVLKPDSLIMEGNKP